jgi:hypothetical protein
VVVTQRRASNTLVDTVLFHLDALTGEDVRRVSPRGAVLEGLDVIAGPVVDVFLLPFEPRTVMLLDEFMQVRSSPFSEKSICVLRRCRTGASLPRNSSCGRTIRQARS